MRIPRGIRITRVTRGCPSLWDGYCVGLCDAERRKQHKYHDLLITYALSSVSETAVAVSGKQP